MDIVDLQKNLFMPIKVISVKDKLIPKFVYLRDTHGKIKIYKSLKTLTSNLKNKDFDLILKYEVTAIKRRNYENFDMSN